MTNYRVLEIDRIIEKLRRGAYRGKLVSADFANTGLQPFDHLAFSGHLGIDERTLRIIGLIRITDQSGWKLPAEPTIIEMERYRHILEALRAYRSL